MDVEVGDDFSLNKSLQATQSQVNVICLYSSSDDVVLESQFLFIQRSQEISPSMLRA